MLKLTCQRARIRQLNRAACASLLLLYLGTLAAGQSALSAAPSYAQLQQLTSQLQSSPANDALRKQIIALALQLPAPPAETADALKAEGAGEYAFKHAQTPADFSSAAEAFEQAARIEPWVAANYYNAGQAYAKAKRFKLAIAALNWYLTAAPNAGDRDAVLKRIGALEYARSHPPHPQPAPNVPPPAPPVRIRVGLKGYWHFVSGKWGYGPFAGNSIVTSFSGLRGLSITGTRDDWRVCMDYAGCPDPRPGHFHVITNESDVYQVKFHDIGSNWTCNRTGANAMECLWAPVNGGETMRLQFAR